VHECWPNNRDNDDTHGTKFGNVCSHFRRRQIHTRIFDVVSSYYVLSEVSFHICERMGYTSNIRNYDLLNVVAVWFNAIEGRE
jgi:hypothetical protein